MLCLQFVRRAGGVRTAGTNVRAFTESAIRSRDSATVTAVMRESAATLVSAGSHFTKQDQGLTLDLESFKSL